MTPSYFSYEVPLRSRWNIFLAGLAIEFAGFLLLAGVAAHFTGSVRPVPSDRGRYVTLIAPSLRPIHSPRLTLPASAPQVAAETPKLAKQVPLEVRPQPREIQPVWAAKIEPPKQDVKVESAAVPPAAIKPAPEIKTNVFTTAPSQVATLNKPAREVQTGGFGDSNGIAGTGDSKRAAITVARVGSFDLPSGPGRGNGSDGSHGLNGTVHSAGFATVASASRSRSEGSVVQGGFGTVVASGGGITSQPLRKEPNLQPVEITYKPRPAYTQEARRMGVEGEVVLEVVFTADGSLQIKRVVKGLGYGLDDSALVAARHIQFRPARRDGQPYDCASLVHMVFELAD